MRVLVIGGNRFVGYQLVWRLVGAGHDVTIINRGSSPDVFLGRVKQMVADRTTKAFEEVLSGHTFDVVVDFALYTKEDAEQVVRLFSGGAIGHYICISSGQVYLVRNNCPSPAQETDYVGDIMTKPTDLHDVADWQYGVDKREAEDVLIDAWHQHQFPSTRLRIPVVNGERDYSKRLESYFWRILDGGPILLPGTNAKLLRQIYSGDVARTIESILLNTKTYGEAYNLAQNEIVTIGELLASAASMFNSRPLFCIVPEETLTQHGLTVQEVSPFHGKWTSIVDASKATRDIAFVPTPLSVYLEKIVSSFLNHIPNTPPSNYKNRRLEHDIAKGYMCE